MLENFLVIDNLIPKTWQNDIERTILSHNFPWYYTSDITFGDDAPYDQRAPAFYHVLRKFFQTQSNYFPTFVPIAHVAAEKINFEFKDIAEARLFLQLPLNENFIKNKADLLHVDPIQENNIVVLYYITDSDGDTVLVDKKRSVPGEFKNNLKMDGEKILAKVTPKKGRCLIFDGDFYHTAYQPNSSVRSIINFNLI